MEILNEANATYVFDGSSVEKSIASNTVSVDLQSAQGLTLTKTANPTEYLAGDIIDYAITITNNSASHFSGVRIIDDLGGGNMAYVLGSATLTVGSLTYNVTPISTHPLTFTLQELRTGETMTLRYKSQIIFNLPASVGVITNNVKGIGYTSTGTIVGFTNETIQKKITDELIMTKSASATVVYANQNFKYFIKIVNNSSASATITKFVDQLPENFELTSVAIQTGSNPPVVLSSDQYLLNGTNMLTIPSATGSGIVVPANENVQVIISGYFS